MKTVPTLCATATTVGVSAVGLSLGRPPTPTNDPVPTTNGKAVSSNILEDSSMLSARAATHTHDNPIHDPAISASNSSLPRSTASRNINGRGRPRKLRRTTSSDGHLHEVNGPEDTFSPLDDHFVDHFDPKIALRSRPSWVKRLSTLSSHSSSRNPSPRPASPSISCSNGSMAFSHDGSTAPIVGNHIPSPLPPNKLVKRSASLRGLNGRSYEYHGSRRPTLRRPATSHQRSATLQRQSRLLDMLESDLNEIELHGTPRNADLETPYTQYFGPKVSKETQGPKRRNTAGDFRTIKRIFPDGKHHPTLLLAKSVTATQVAIDDSGSQDGESVHNESRPSTPPKDPTSAFNHSGKVISTPSAPPTSQPTPQNTPAESQGRRSFSIGDMFSAGGQSWKQRSSRVPPTKLTKRISRRISSAPSHNKSTSNGDRSNGTENLKQRRDITDPDIFQANPSPKIDHRALPSTPAAPSNATPISEPRLTQIPHENVSPQDSSSVSPSPRIGSSSNRDSLNAQLPSSNLTSPVQRQFYPSMAASERASTLIGSDNETRGVLSGDDSDTDFQSETVFDSLRTGITKSTSGPRGPRIETIFDESPPRMANPSKTLVLRSSVTKFNLGNQEDDKIEWHTNEENSVSTPIHNKATQAYSQNSHMTQKPSVEFMLTPGISSSPPDVSNSLSLGTLEWDEPEMENETWSSSEGDAVDPWAPDYSGPPVQQNHGPTLVLKRRLPRHPVSNSSPLGMGHSTLGEGSDRDTRSSIFDWSEQVVTDRSPGNRTPPRPRTVHGKKDTDTRGGRSVGRRAPSGLHARSQSVPVVPDVVGKRQPVVTNKFGTWGVGSKGVAEDWNDDFDFSDSNDADADNDGKEESRIDSGMSIDVPKMIQEQQSNVLANIGLLREWGILIEELKELRSRAIALDLQKDEESGMWQEVDAMIDLADQEAEDEPIVPRLTPPSSPGIDLTAFDESSHQGGSPMSVRTPRKINESLVSDPSPKPAYSPAQPEPVRSNSTVTTPVKSKTLESPTARFSRTDQIVAGSSPTRPRKDSEAVARSVIEALQRRKNVSEPIPSLKPVPPSQKVPFDTATLRHIVPYVNGLKRRVKDTLRHAEGLYTSPRRSPARTPSLSRLFIDPADESPSSKRTN